MKSSRYSPEQVTPVYEVCRKMGINEQTFYRWKKNFQGMGVAEVRRLRVLEFTGLHTLTSKTVAGHLRLSSHPVAE